MIIRLDQPIECITLCKQIQRLIDRHKKENPDLTKFVVSVRISEIVDAKDNEAKKLEYRP